MNRIKELRQKNNLTLRELGKKVDMSSSRISQYETGKREPKLETWKKLADFFDVPVPYLQGIQSNYTQRDVFRILNNNYFNSDNNLYDIHEILEEVFTFSPDIPRLDSLFSRD
ncbi:helix-turn-helix domain-containing protein, partial [Lactobacillus helveticus]